MLPDIERCFEVLLRFFLNSTTKGRTGRFISPLRSSESIVQKINQGCSAATPFRPTLLDLKPDIVLYGIPRQSTYGAAGAPA